MLLLAIPLVLYGAAGLGAGTDFGQNTQEAAVLRAGIEVEYRSFSFGLSALGVPGPMPAQRFCTDSCYGNSSFAAISGFATARWSPNAFFAEAGAGVGHLLTLSADDLYEDPVLEGRGAFAWLAGAGARWGIGDGLQLGFEGLVTQWNGVSQAAHTRGTAYVPAVEDGSVIGIFVTASLWWAP